jgi:ribosomal protein S18 acetylase RimI-like enzyme
MSTVPLFRDAIEDDSSHLAILIDAASRRLTAWVWSTLAAPGQSVFEVGRERIRTNTGNPSYYANWRIAEVDGRVAGALNCYPIATPYEAVDLSALPEIYHPLIALEEIAQGSFYIQVASVFPEFRGKGVGRAILGEAQRLAEAPGADRMSLIVESFNEGAHRFYLREGFTEWARRSFIPFPGSQEEGDFILMRKDLA